MGVPSHGLRLVLAEVKKFLRPWVPLISLSKGLERDTMLRMTQVIQDVIPDHLAGALTGPNLAREIMAGFAAASVIAIDDGARRAPGSARVPLGACSASTRITT
jgi:glycerol-3-phosphate dehydrogenase (NAD(P)+)